MTKEEIIKEAYGEYWDQLHYNAKECAFKNNGWINSVLNNMLEGIDCDFEDRCYRPKSLQGIENNKGWIKIKSEADLPKEDYGNYHVYSNKEIFGSEPKNQGSDDFYKENNKIKDWLENYTHYQPIIKPEPPIY